MVYCDLNGSMIELKKIFVQFSSLHIPLYLVQIMYGFFFFCCRGIGGIPMHLRISLLHGEYVLGENSQPFPTVPEMVDYYTRHDLPVQNASHIKLLHPIARPRM